MAKYRLLYDRLIAQGIAQGENVFISSPATKSQMQLAHTSEYIDRFSSGRISEREMKKLGLIWSEQLVKRTFTAVGGTILTCKLAKEFDLACHLAGGTHHAFADQGMGFCVFNDIAIAAKYLIESGLSKQVLIIDCDVHQGDGTAKILEDEQQCFTCSIHARTNYPFEKMSSDLDVEVDKDAGDGQYLEVLESTLDKLDRAINPDFVIYDGGSDVHEDDRLGHLKLTDSGVQQRDKRVIEWARSKNLPVACVIGGGYDHDHQELARRHSLLPESAQQHYLKEQTLKIPS
ncbi:MAG: histone deacetylase [Motiliproteus sp.]|nr:histone deacetylase [Motiliproteus sp.]MCW9052435.1 histone deacetylase [Motiliproteus sp.]